MRKFGIAFVGLLTAALASGCGDDMPAAVGPAQEILVMADPDDWAALEAPIKDVFEKVIYTPQEEKLFNVRFARIGFEEMSRYRERKNVLIVSPLDAAHETGELLRSLLSEDVIAAARSGGRGAVSWKRDVWANDQLVLVVTGATVDDVVDNLRMEADRLYGAVEDARNERIAQLIYRYGEREDVTRQLMEDYGWQIRVPFGYRVLEAKPDSGFVALAKEEPNRWFFVYWEDGVSPDTITEDWTIAKRNEITARFFDNDRIAPGEVQVFEQEFSGKLAVVLQGLWQNEANWTGGPFKSYAFVDVELNRFFFIDVGIFSPNKQKETYLRQLDLIAQTFNYAREGRG